MRFIDKNTFSWLVIVSFLLFHQMKSMCRLYISKQDQQDRHPQIRGPYLRGSKTAVRCFKFECNKDLHALILNFERKIFYHYIYSHLLESAASNGNLMERVAPFLHSMFYFYPVHLETDSVRLKCLGEWITSYLHRQVLQHYQQ